jgi:hypothetical protein
VSVQSPKEHRQSVRARLLGSHIIPESTPQKAYAGRRIAAIYRCAACRRWWISSDLDIPATRLIFRFVEPHLQRYLWQDYLGWRREAETRGCAACARQITDPACQLRFDNDGYIVWPEANRAQQDTDGRDRSPGQEANPFAAYIASSKNIDENMFVIAAWEARREAHAWGYTADINNMRDELEEMRTAFKDVVSNYAALLPSGWRVTADFDKWLKGQACAGFLHGEIQPDISLRIGGDCSTVAELEMKLDCLFQMVCRLAC